MYGVEEEPMMSPYSSFSITITAIRAGPPGSSRAVGEGVRCTGRALLVAPQPASSAASKPTIDTATTGAMIAVSVPRGLRDN